MADMSPIGALSSLLSEKDLYYQYLIDNNTKSTMFKALGADDGSSDVDGSIGYVGEESSFYSILQRCLGGGLDEAASMGARLEEALDAAEDAGEDSTQLYKTVQEIYDYFVEKTASAAAQSLPSLAEGLPSSGQTDGQTAEAFSSRYDDFDFDGFESEAADAIQSSIAAAGRL